MPHISEQFKVGTWFGAAVYWHPEGGLSWEWEHSWLLQFSDPTTQYEQIEWLPASQLHDLAVECAGSPWVFSRLLGTVLEVREAGGKWDISEEAMCQS